MEEFLHKPLFSIHDVHITLFNAIGGVLIIFISIIAAIIVKRLLYRKAVKMNSEAGKIKAFSKIIQYAVVITGIFTGLEFIGFNLTIFLAGGTAVLVAIGFGTKNIFNNFISGIILLFERPIKEGDLIEVSGMRGIVDSIGTRSTKILTGDHVTIIVPNSYFLDNEVINYSYLNDLRISIPVRVSYKSNVEDVKNVLLTLANDNVTVLKDPKPDIVIDSIEDSSVNMTLLVWLSDEAHGRIVKSELYFAIFDEFNKQGIEIPFPQRDIHIKSETK